jgi:hypothetical protein
MRFRRGSVRFCSLLLGCCLTTGAASAQLLVAAEDADAIAYAELAFASGEGTPVTWLSLRVRHGSAAVVAALPDDAVLEPSLDAWFGALETTASPNVLKPQSAPTCEDGKPYVRVAWPRSSGVEPSELLVESPEDVTAALDEQGLTLGPGLPPAKRYAIWSWTGQEQAWTTRTLRVLGGSSPLSLLPGPGRYPVLVSSFTRGAQSYGDEVSHSELPITFIGGEPARTDYIERVRSWLEVRDEPLLETRIRGPIFDWAIYDDAVSLPSLVLGYARRAALALPGIDADLCARQLRALRDENAPAAAACGDALDLSLALAATGREPFTLQRHVFAAAVTIAPAEHEGGEPSEPIVRARTVDASACNPAQNPPIASQPPRVPDEPAVSGAGSGSGSRTTTTVVVEEGVYLDDSEAGCGAGPTYPEEDRESADSCSGTSSSSSSSNDSCSGDSSSTSEDDGDACSGDSSSSSRSDDDSCAGDSSSSSSAGDDDTCSGDSSSSSNEDSGCDGGSEDSGYDGDTCTGKAAPVEPTQRSQATLSDGRRRPGRIKLSLWSMALAAVVLPFRRRKRRLFASG